jgi:hypothetical protein
VEYLIATIRDSLKKGGTSMKRCGWEKQFFYPYFALIGLTLGFNISLRRVPLTLHEAALLMVGCLAVLIGWAGVKIYFEKRYTDYLDYLGNRWVVGIAQFALIAVSLLTLFMGLMIGSITYVYEVGSAASLPILEKSVSFLITHTVVIGVCCLPCSSYYVASPKNGMGYDDIFLHIYPWWRYKKI